MDCPKCGHEMKHVHFTTEENHRPGECYTCWDCEEDYPITAMSEIASLRSELSASLKLQQDLAEDIVVIGKENNELIKENERLEARLKEAERVIEKCEDAYTLPITDWAMAISAYRAKYPEGK